MKTATKNAVLFLAVCVQFSIGDPLISKGTVQSPQTININAQIKPSPLLDKYNRLKAALSSLFQMKMGELSIIANRLSQIAAQRTGNNQLLLLQAQLDSAQGMPTLQQALVNMLGTPVQPTAQTAHQGQPPFQEQQTGWPTAQAAHQGAQGHPTFQEQLTGWPTAQTAHQEQPTYQGQPTGWPTAHATQQGAQGHPIYQEQPTTQQGAQQGAQQRAQSVLTTQGQLSG